MTTVEKLDVAPGAKSAAALMNINDVAVLLDCSVPHVRRLNDAGKMPRSVRIGSLLRWRRTDLTDWIAAGCPTCRDRRTR